MKRDLTILLDIARAARLVLEFKEGMDKDAFLDDVKTQSSVLHQLMVMGEAVKRLSDGFRSQNPEIPWPLIAGHLYLTSLPVRQFMQREPVPA